MVHISGSGTSDEGANGVIFTRIPSTETTYGLDFAKFRQCHAKFQVKHCNYFLRPVVNGAHRLILFGLPQGAINKILKRAMQTGSPYQRLLGHRQRISTTHKDRYLLRMILANRFLSRPRL